MGTNWKTRGHYGSMLQNKIDRLNKELTQVGDRKKMNAKQLAKYMAISKTQDYSIQVQMSNIKAVEEFQTLEKLET